MEPCCQLGAKQHNPAEVLFESDNFFVATNVGPIGIQGYVLLLSKDHAMGMGDVDREDYQELQEVLTHTTDVLKSAYGVDPLVFEHGPKVGGLRGGGCLDHAHLHIVPGARVLDQLASDLFKRLDSSSQFYRVDRVDGFQRLADIYAARETSYLMVQSEGARFVSEVNYSLPSQYLRRMIAQSQGKTTWSWKKDPQPEIVQRTFEMLQGKF